MDRDYRSLNLDRDAIEGVVNAFIESQELVLESLGEMPGTQNGVRVVFGATGQQFATVNIYFNRDGTSTVQFLTGANRDLGKLLADQLYESINPAEFEQVNLVLEGFIETTTIPVLELSGEEEHIDVNEHDRNDSRIIWKITSPEYQDELTVTLHTRTRKLQIQGRPLFCYRTLIFNLSELLDLKGLEKVLVRQDDGKAEIVQQEVASSHLKAVLGDSYDNLHQNVEKLLISGLCVKLAAPALPDYCLLLYPELRSIEGVLKDKMYDLGMEVGREGFGEYFDKDQNSFILGTEHRGRCPNVECAEILEEAYSFFNRERHGLFHMETIVEASRVIGNITHLMTKSNQAWEHIKKLYSI